MLQPGLDFVCLTTLAKENFYFFFFGSLFTGELRSQTALKRYVLLQTVPVLVAKY